MKKKLIIGFCSVLLAFVVIGGCDYIANKSIENVKKEQNNNNKVKYEKQKESYDNKFTDKYGALLDSDKLSEFDKSDFKEIILRKAPIGIAAEGITEVYNLEHIDRGYENIEEKFRNIGANIKRVKE